MTLRTLSTFGTSARTLTTALGLAGMMAIIGTGSAQAAQLSDSVETAAPIAALGDLAIADMITNGAKRAQVNVGRRYEYDRDIYTGDDRVVYGQAVPAGQHNAPVETRAGAYDGAWSGNYVGEDGRVYQGSWTGQYRDESGAVYDGRYSGTFTGDGELIDANGQSATRQFNGVDYDQRNGGDRVYSRNTAAQIPEPVYRGGYRQAPIPGQVRNQAPVPRDPRYNDYRSQAELAERCRRDNGVGGALIGGAVGALAGNRIAGRGSRTAGTLIGGAVGAVAGAVIDRSEADPCRDFQQQAARQDYRGGQSYYPQQYGAPPGYYLYYPAPTVTTVTVHPAATTTTTTTTTTYDDVYTSSHAAKPVKRQWRK